LVSRSHVWRFAGSEDHVAAAKATRAVPLHLLPSLKL
jgi:hypothetical protein